MIPITRRSSYFVDNTYHENEPICLSSQPPIKRAFCGSFQPIENEKMDNQFQPLEADECLFWQERAQRWKVKKSLDNLQTLKNLCFNTLAQTCSNEHLIEGHVPLFIMKPALKEEMLEYLKANRLRILGRFAKQLLHEESTRMDFGVVKRGRDQAEVWNHMLDVCCFMKIIIWRDYNGVSYTPFPILDLLNMPEVVHIEMPDFWCDAYALSIFAQHYKELRVLQVSLLKLEADELQAILQLENLQVFDFHGSKLSPYDKKRDTEVMAQLLLSLRKLEVIWPSYAETCDHGQSMKILFNHNLQTDIKLKKMRIKESPSYWMENISEVEELYLDGNSEDYCDVMNLAKNLPKLKSLNVKFNSELCNRFLRQTLGSVGSQLTELVIEIMDTRYDVRLNFSSIMGACNQLEKLHVSGRVVCVDDEQGYTPAHFSKLKNVKFYLLGTHHFSMILNCVVSYANDIEYLKVSPLHLFKTQSLLRNIVTKICNHYDSFSQLKELWITLGNPEGAPELSHSLKFLVFSSTKLEKIVLNVNMFDCSPYFGNLQAFCQHFVPQIDLLIF